MVTVATADLGLTRRAGLMFVLVFTRTTDVASLLFLATVPVQLAALATADVPVAFAYLAIGGWSVYVGASLAREMFQARDPWESGGSAGMIVATNPVGVVLGMAVHANLTVLLAIGAGALLQPPAPGVGVFAAIIIGPANSYLGTIRWYLSPTLAVVEIVGRAVSDEPLLPDALRGRLLTEQDLRALFTRQPRVR